MAQYENYKLSRTVSVKEIVTADYFTGCHPGACVHVHPDAWELCCCLGGTLTLLRDFREIPLQKGQTALVQPGTPHDLLVRDEHAATFVVSFTCSGEYLRTVQNSVVTFTQEQLRLFYSMVEELRSGFKQDNHQVHLVSFRPSEDSPFGAEQMICSYLEQILITLLRSVTMKNGEIVRSDRFKDAMQSYLAERVYSYIQENLGEHLTLASIAAHFHYSRSRLADLFKSASEMGIYEVIDHERMRKAKFLLQEGVLSVGEIARQLGYATPQYFSAKFTRETGCPPSRYANSAEAGERDEG